MEGKGAANRCFGLYKVLLPLKKPLDEWNLWLMSFAGFVSGFSYSLALRKSIF